MKTIFKKKAVDLGKNEFGLRFKSLASLNQYREKLLERAIKTNFGGDMFNWAASIETNKYIFTFESDSLTVYAFTKKGAK